jgi:hypothetical protein
MQLQVYKTIEPAINPLGDLNPSIARRIGYIQTSHRSAINLICKKSARAQKSWCW